MVLDTDGRRLHRVIGFFREFRRVDPSTPDGDISLIGQELNVAVDECYEDAERTPTSLPPRIG